MILVIFNSNFAQSFDEFDLSLLVCFIRGRIDGHVRIRLLFVTWMEERASMTLLHLFLELACIIIVINILIVKIGWHFNKWLLNWLNHWLLMTRHLIVIVVGHPLTLTQILTIFMCAFNFLNDKSYQNQEYNE